MLLTPRRDVGLGKTMAYLVCNSHRLSQFLSSFVCLRRRVDVRRHGRSYMVCVCGQPTTATTLWPLSLQETVYVVNTFFAQDVRSLHDGCLGAQRLSHRAAVPPSFVCVRVVVAWVVVFLQAVAIERLWALYVRTVVRTWYVANATTLLPLLPREIFTW